MSVSWSQECKKKIISPHNLEKRAVELRHEGHTLVTINGSFDLMHSGHLYILHQAKQQGDILIVALNSDKSIQGYKGKNRPFIPLPERIEMMCAFEFVDFVTWFDELDPCAILHKIKPHIHANGSEYGQDCIESKTVQSFGGEIYLIDRIPKLSTSAIIDKIKGV